MTKVFRYIAKQKDEFVKKKNRRKYYWYILPWFSLERYESYILCRVESNLKYWTITMIKITWDYYNSVFYVCLTDQWNCHSIQIFLKESKHRESFQIINVFQPNYQYSPVFCNNVLYKWGMDFHKLGSHKLRWKWTHKTLLSN